MSCFWFWCLLSSSTQPLALDRELAALALHYSIDHNSSHNAGLGHLPCMSSRPYGDRQNPCVMPNGTQAMVEGYWVDPYVVGGKRVFLAGQPVNIKLPNRLLNDISPSQPSHLNSWSDCVALDGEIDVSLANGRRWIVSEQRWSVVMRAGFDRLYSTMPVQPWMEANQWLDCPAASP